MKSGDTVSSRSDIIYNGILPLKIGKIKGEKRNFIGDTNFSINKDDNVVIIGGNASGKTILGIHIYEEINKLIDNGSISKHKLELITETELKIKTAELLRDIDYRTINPGRLEREAVFRIISDIEIKIEENKSAGIETIVIFDFPTITPTVIFAQPINELEATTIHFMLTTSSTLRDSRKISELGNKFIFLERNTQDGTTVIYQDGKNNEVIRKIEILYSQDILILIAKSLALIESDFEYRSTNSKALSSINSAIDFPLLFEELRALDEVLFNEKYTREIESLLNSIFKYRKRDEERDTEINDKIRKIFANMSDELAKEAEHIPLELSRDIGDLLKGKKISRNIRMISKRSRKLKRTKRRQNKLPKMIERFAKDHYNIKPSHRIEMNSSIALMSSSIALILSDVNENNDKLSKSLMKLALQLSSFFKIKAGRNQHQINAIINSEGRKFLRQDVVGAIYSGADKYLADGEKLRKLQEIGGIGHIDVNLNTFKSGITGEISISSNLSEDENARIGIGLESIEQIGDEKVEIKIDQRIGLEKKVILVNTSEKYLQYYYNIKDEKNTRIMFYQHLDRDLEYTKDLLKGTDILIIDCDGRLKNKMISITLNFCRPEGTANYGHFLFIEINNNSTLKRLKATKRNHPFDEWKLDLRGKTKTTEQSFAAGLKNIINYYHSDIGDRLIEQETKKATFIQELVKSTDYDWKDRSVTESEGSNWKNHDFKCLNEELISFFEMLKDVFDQKLFKELEKLDAEIYQSDWGNASYTTKKIIDEISINKEYFNPEVYRKRSDLIYVMNDLNLIFSYLNHGICNTLQSKEYVSEYEERILDELRSFMAPSGEILEDNRNFNTRNKKYTKDYSHRFFMKLIFLETRKHLITLDEKKLKIIRDRIILDWNIDLLTHTRFIGSPLYRLNVLQRDRRFSRYFHEWSEYQSIFERKLSPILILKHNEIDFTINEDSKWNPDIGWKTSHLEKLSVNPVSTTHREYLIADLWSILTNEMITTRDNILSEKVWGMLNISNKTWLLATLIELLSKKVIHSPDEKIIQIDTVNTIKKWIDGYPWEIEHLFIAIEIFRNLEIDQSRNDSDRLKKELVELNKLYLNELNKFDYDSNMNILEEIWIEYVQKKKTKQGLEEWFSGMKNDL